MPDNRDNNAAQGPENGRSTSWFAEVVLRHRLITNLVIHNVLFTIALLMAYLVRFDAGWPGEGLQAEWFYTYFLPSLPFFLVVKTLIFSRLTTY